MKIGDMIYGAFPGLDTFVEKIGARRFVIRVRDERSGELLEKLQVMDYSKREALAAAEKMALDIIAARAA